MENFHIRLHQEWEDLLKEICKTPLSKLSDSEASLRKRAEHLQQVAEKIGGRALQDTLLLVEDVRKFLSGQMSLAETARMMEHALRVEQDTKEL